MKHASLIINYCLFPIICVLPMFGLLACGNIDNAAVKAGAGIETVGQQITNLPQNFREASPYLKQDLETLWCNVTGDIEVYAQEFGVEQSVHPLADAEEARERLISGESFNEVLRKAMNELTKDDLQNMPTSDFSALNGVLPFEIDLTKCGESLADVLNSLDIGQVSAVLRSDAGYHIIQLIDRNGGQVKIGHILFEVAPPVQTAEEESSEETSDPIAEAIERLKGAIQNR